MVADHNRVWQNLPEPPTGHPDEALLWEAELAFQSIAELSERPDIRNAFVKRLDAFRSELEDAANLVIGTEHSIAFVGNIGVGKSTALCRVAGLEITDGMLGEPTPVLETGGGGTTICEVHILNGPDYGLIVEARRESELREEVAEFARLLMPTSGSGPDDETRISREVSRAIRNMSGLLPERNPDGTFRRDPARNLAEELNDADALAEEIWSKMGINKRNRREIWHSNDSDAEPLQWLQENFRRLNYGRHPDFSLPKRIEVILPERILGERSLSIRIVDTKGIDDTAEREDLAVHLNEPNTVAVLCSDFNAAPATSVQRLLERAVEARYPDLETKSAVLVLPHPRQALAMKDELGDSVTTVRQGYQIKREHTVAALQTANLPNVRVGFFNVYEDDVDQFNAFLMEQVAGLRRMHNDRLEEVVIGALTLVENFEKEQVWEIQREAAGYLSRWINNSREIDGLSGNLQDTLFQAINVVNASSLRASVRRGGEWHRLDYSHQLSHGARVTADSAVASQLVEFRAMINLLLQNPDLEDAFSLLQQARRVLDAGTDNLLRRSQDMGRAVHTEYMKPDGLFWQRCIEEWGQGSGYKVRVAGHHEDWFANDQHGITTQAEELVTREWQQILSRIEIILPGDEED